MEMRKARGSAPGPSWGRRPQTPILFVPGLASAASVTPAKPTASPVRPGPPSLGDPQPLHNSAFHATFALNRVRDAAGGMRTIIVRLTALLPYPTLSLPLTMAASLAVVPPLLLQSAVAAHAGQVPGDVPFVGCPADGMMGPVAAPRAPKHTPTVPTGAESRLAYYESQRMGTVAPRGWHCIELYGSSGAFLLVTPKQGIATHRFPDGRHVTGPAIEVSFTNGDTSGRFEVAKVIARLFPTKNLFVQQVIEEGI